MSRYKPGDVRVKSRFLFTPLVIKGERRWMEWARWEEEWSPWKYLYGGKWLYKRWL